MFDSCHPFITLRTPRTRTNRIVKISGTNINFYVSSMMYVYVTGTIYSVKTYVHTIQFF